MKRIQRMKMKDRKEKREIKERGEGEGKVAEDAQA